MPGPPFFTNPIVELWERIESEDFNNVVKHSLVIYLPYFVFQIFLPFYSDDILKQSQGFNLEMPIVPLLIDQKYLIKDFGYYNFFSEDLSSIKKQKNVPFEITIKSDEKRFSILK